MAIQNVSSRIESLGAGRQRMETWFRNCSCGCSQVHGDDENGTDYSWEQFVAWHTCIECSSSNRSVAMVCHDLRNLGASQTTSAGNGTCAHDDNRMQVDSLKQGEGQGKGKHPNQKGTRTSNTSNTDVNTCKTCSRTNTG